RIGGSGVFARDPDTILVMTRHEQQDSYVIESTLRNFPPIQPFCVRWEYPLMVPAPELNPDELKQGSGRGPRVPTDDEFLSFFFPTGRPRTRASPCFRTRSLRCSSKPASSIRTL